MKHILLLAALIFAAPAWAAETAAVPVALQASSTQTTTQAAPTAKSDKKKTRKHAKKHPKDTLTCPTGCFLTTCAGVAICAKNKPAPLCTAC